MRLIIIFILLFLWSCFENKKTDSAISEPVNSKNDQMVHSIIQDKNGQKLDLMFNNSKYTVFLKFRQDTSTLLGQRVGSGIWYKNEHYELRGKGEHNELSKDGKIIFSN